MPCLLLILLFFSFSRASLEPVVVQLPQLLLGVVFTSPSAWVAPPNSLFLSLAPFTLVLSGMLLNPHQQIFCWGLSF